eukprot:1395334-Amorphochlora_amoeboformis.AAC.1
MCYATSHSPPHLATDLLRLLGVWIPCCPSNCSAVSRHACGLDMRHWSNREDAIIARALPDTDASNPQDGIYQEDRSHSVGHSGEYSVLAALIKVLGNHATVHEQREDQAAGHRGVRGRGADEPLRGHVDDEESGEEYEECQRGGRRVETPKAVAHFTEGPEDETVALDIDRDANPREEENGCGEV